VGDATGTPEPEARPIDRRWEKVAARLNVASSELDRLTLDADERSRSIDAKASFLAVASGVVFGGQIQAEFAVPWYVASLPLLLVTIALAAAGVSFLPRTLQGNSPQMIWLAYHDSQKSAASVATEIDKVRVQTETAREAALSRRASVITFGFSTLFASMLLFVALFAVTSALK
jgi:hypothetical protein